MSNYAKSIPQVPSCEKAPALLENLLLCQTGSSLLALKLREFLDTPGAAQAAGGAPHLTSEPHQLGSARAPLPPLAEWPRPSARLNPSGPPVNSVWVDAFFYGFWMEEHKARTHHPARPHAP